MHTPKIAFCRYRTPPWINFVDLEDVPLAKSSPSIKAVFNPGNEFDKKKYVIQQQPNISQ